MSVALFERDTTFLAGTKAAELNEEFDRLYERVAGALRVEITASNSFNANELVGYSGGSWGTALATSSGRVALGAVESATSSSFVLVLLGLVESVGHGIAAGVNYLSDSVSGAGTTTAPFPSGTNFRQPVLFGLTPDLYLVKIGDAVGSLP